MEEFELKLRSLIQKSKDIMFLLSELEASFGHTNQQVIELKDKFSRIQENIAYAKSCFDKGMKDTANQHIAYAQTIMTRMERDIRDKSKIKQKDISSPLSILSLLAIGILILVILPYFLVGNDEFIDRNIVNVVVTDVLSPLEQVRGTLNTFTIQNRIVEYDMNVVIQKFGKEYEYLPMYVVNETHKGHLMIENVKGNQKVTSRLIDYLTIIRTRIDYYTRGGRYTCNERYSNCNPVSLSLLNNRNLYSKLHRIIDNGYTLSFSETKFRDCVEVKVSTPLLTRKDVEGVFGRVYYDNVEGYYTADICLNYQTGEIKHFTEHAGYLVRKQNGDNLFEHTITYILVEE